jgi:hypothetical protein
MRRAAVYASLNGDGCGSTTELAPAFCALA